MKDLNRHIERWYAYQQERFPLVVHGPLVVAFGAAAIGLSAHLRGAAADGWAMAAACASLLLFFLHLRIADEFKDYAEDCRHRPQRAVPRGLVSLRELGVVGVGAALVQIALALLVDPALLALLAVGWGYFGLMNAEFFAPAWLKARPLLYLVSHMAIVPLLALYATAFDWAVAGAAPPPALGWFLAASFFSGCALEIGRKLRAPADERPGVPTYTAQWGRRPAVAAWSAALVGALIAAGGVAHAVGSATWMMAGLGVASAGALAFGLRFLHRPVPRRARLLEAASGLWTLALYGGFAVLSFF